MITLNQSLKTKAIKLNWGYTQTGWVQILL